MSLPLVAVLTGNSNSGAQAVEDLIERFSGSARVRGCYRSEEKAAAYQQKYGNNANYESMTTLKGEDAASLDQALTGATFAILVTPHDPTRGFADDAQLSANMIEAAVRNNVQHIIYIGSWTVHYPDDISAIAARFVPSEALLHTLGESGKVRWTSLRSGYFNQNLLGLAASIKEKSSVAFPDLLIPCVDPRDMGRVAAAICASPSPEQFHSQSLDISGPETLSMKQIVAKISAATGKDIAYTPVPAASLTFLPPYLQELLCFMEANPGKLPLSTATADIAGSHTTLEEWLGDFKQAFC